MKFELCSRLGLGRHSGLFWRSLDLKIKVLFDEKTCGLEAGEPAAGPGWQPDELLSTRIEKTILDTQPGSREDCPSLMLTSY